MNCRTWATLVGVVLGLSVKASECLFQEFNFTTRSFQCFDEFSFTCTEKVHTGGGVCVWGGGGPHKYTNGIVFNLYRGQRATLKSKTFTALLL